MVDMGGWVWQKAVLALHNGTFPKAKNSTVSVEFSMGSKFDFFQFNTYFFQFLDTFLKFEEMACLIHYVKFKI